MTRQDFPLLLQLRVLRFRFLQDGGVRVGVLPESEEILVGGAGFREAALQRVGGYRSEMDDYKKECVSYSNGMR